MGKPRLSVTSHTALHASIGEAVRPHAMQAWKLVIGVDATLELERQGAALGGARAVLIAPGFEHAMRAEGAFVALLFEPGERGLPFPKGRPGLTVYEGQQRDALCALGREALYSDDEHDAARADEAAALLDLERGPRVDPRVRRALEALASDPEVDLEALALRQRLSTSRLRHLIQETTGLSPRTHRLWHRTLRATEDLMHGAPIAHAAARAGFADHGHFTRAFMRFVGRTPSSLRLACRIEASYARRAG